jgi:hypothetical protein
MVPCGLTLSASCSRYFHAPCLMHSQRVFQVEDFPHVGLPRTLIAVFALTGDRDWTKSLLLSQDDSLTPRTIPGLAAACDHCLQLAGMTQRDVDDLGFLTLSDILEHRRRQRKRSRSESPPPGKEVKERTEHDGEEDSNPAKRSIRTELLDPPALFSCQLINPLPSPRFEDVMGQPLGPDCEPSVASVLSQSISPELLVHPGDGHPPDWSLPLSDAPAIPRCSPSEKQQLADRSEQVRTSLLAIE